MRGQMAADMLATPLRSPFVAFICIKRMGEYEKMISFAWCHFEGSELPLRKESGVALLVEPIGVGIYLN